MSVRALGAGFAIVAIALSVIFAHQYAGVPLSVGVLTGSAGILGLILLRQILAILENGKLNTCLQLAYVELESKNRMLQGLVARDSMTGLANHGTFQDRLRSELSRSARSGRPVSLLLIDADYFKRYNDSFGHQAGDAVLKSLAGLLEDSVREADLVARYGGEEFAVILVETGTEGAELTAERIRAAVEQFPSTSRRITVSIGLATAHEGHYDATLLVAHADQALYAAKRAGRNRIHIWHNQWAASPPRHLPETAESAPNLTASESEPAGLVANIGLGSEGEIVRGVLAALDLRDCETNGHSQRVACLALRLARELTQTRGEALSEVQLRELYLGGLLHDIGKLAVPDHVLHKADVLTADEWEVIQRHPIQGTELLAKFPELAGALPVVLYHHERWDGSGYPYGIAGEDIPLIARIFAVADAADSMASDRPYRKRHGFEAIRGEIDRGSAAQFDPQIVEAFLRIEEADWQRIRNNTDPGELLSPLVERPKHSCVSL